MIANTPEPPYTAVIFTSLRTDGDNGYSATAEHMGELAAQQPGYLGIESARDGLNVHFSVLVNTDAPEMSRRMS